MRTPSRTVLRGRGSASFAPPTDAATFRDLLLFEERLKSNALVLRRRKSRYQCFLLQLLIVIAFLLAEVLLSLDTLSLPYAYLLARLLPEIYAPDVLGKSGERPRLHPAFATGLLMVSIATLVLFFASGLYTEKIGYANRYVPHANKPLRALNMHLNVRRPPFYARLPLPSCIFTAFGRSSPAASPSATASPPRAHSPLGGSTSEPADPSSPVTRAPPTPPSPPRSGVPLAPIPPSANPRGELIFSSRVPAAFTAPYARHRAAFERRRALHERDVRARTLLGRVHNLLARVFWERDDGGSGLQSPVSTPAGTRSATPAPGVRAATPSPSRRPKVGGGPSAGEVAAALMTRTLSGGRRSASTAERPGLGRRESGLRLGGEGRRDREGVET